MNNERSDSEEVLVYGEIIKKKGKKTFILLFWKLASLGATKLKSTW